VWDESDNRNGYPLLAGLVQSTIFADKDQRGEIIQAGEVQMPRTITNKYGYQSSANLEHGQQGQQEGDPPPGGRQPVKNEPPEAQNKPTPKLKRKPRKG
jgi:hypothetical protein